MTTISKNVYIDKPPKILHKYNNTIHRSIKMKPVNIKPDVYVGFPVEFQNLLLCTNLKIQNTYFQRVVNKIGQNKCLWLEMLKMHHHRYVMGHLIKNCKKQTKQTLELKK